MEVNKVFCPPRTIKINNYSYRSKDTLIKDYS